MTATRATVTGLAAQIEHVGKKVANGQFPFLSSII
jgi:hypothetical protein